jgi:hypothetical protein
MFLTGGLLAPIVGAALSALTFGASVSLISSLSVLSGVSGTLMVSGLFGTLGARLGGRKLARVTASVSVFEFREVDPDRAGQGDTAAKGSADGESAPVEDARLAVLLMVPGFMAVKGEQVRVTKEQIERLESVPDPEDELPAEVVAAVEAREQAAAAAASATEVQIGPETLDDTDDVACAATTPSMTADDPSTVSALDEEAAGITPGDNL